MIMLTRTSERSTISKDTIMVQNIPNSFEDHHLRILLENSGDIKVSYITKFFSSTMYATLRDEYMCAKAISRFNGTILMNKNLILVRIASKNWRNVEIGRNFGSGLIGPAYSPLPPAKNYGPGLLAPSPSVSLDSLLQPPASSAIHSNNQGSRVGQPLIRNYGPELLAPHPPVSLDSLLQPPASSPIHSSIQDSQVGQHLIRNDGSKLIAPSHSVAPDQLSQPPNWSVIHSNGMNPLMNPRVLQQHILRRHWQEGNLAYRSEHPVHQNMHTICKSSPCICKSIIYL